jgi:hypothetical protein
VPGTFVRIRQAFLPLCRGMGLFIDGYQLPEGHSIDHVQIDRQQGGNPTRSEAHLQ